MALISTGKAARIAGVTRETIQNYIRDGILHADSQTPGGHYRLDEQHVRKTLCSSNKLTTMLG